MLKALDLRKTILARHFLHLLLILAFAGVCAKSVCKVLEATWTRTLSSVHARQNSIKLSRVILFPTHLVIFVVLPHLST